MDVLASDPAPNEGLGKGPRSVPVFVGVNRNMPLLLWADDDMPNVPPVMGTSFKFSEMRPTRGIRVYSKGDWVAIQSTMQTQRP